MPRGRLVAPALAGLQTYREIVDWRGGRDGARRGPVTAEEDMHRTVLRHVFRRLADAYGRTQFQFRRQGDPELEATCPPCFVEPAAVPHAAASLHPLDAAGRQHTLDVVRIYVADRAFENVCQSGNTRMGMESPVERGSLMVEKIEKHEWLQDLA